MWQGEGVKAYSLYFCTALTDAGLWLFATDRRQVTKGG